jgi:ABC-type branched-subunit amino acid transport system substrate-binding protein
VQPVQSLGEWHRAYELLATVEPDGRSALYALLQSQGGIAARALELVVVTSTVDVPLADRLVQRALSRRGTSVVFVSDVREPQLLRLQTAGIPVAVVASGDDLAAKLCGREVRVA